MYSTCPNTSLISIQSHQSIFFLFNDSNEVYWKFRNFFLKVVYILLVVEPRKGIAYSGKIVISGLYYNPEITNFPHKLRLYGGQLQVLYCTSTTYIILKRRGSPRIIYSLFLPCILLTRKIAGQKCGSMFRGSSTRMPVKPYRTYAENLKKIYRGYPEIISKMSTLPEFTAMNLWW